MVPSMLFPITWMGCSTTCASPSLWMGCSTTCVGAKCLFPLLWMLVLNVYFPAFGWGVVPSMVLVLSVYFPACGWGVSAKCLFAILWMGC